MVVLGASSAVASIIAVIASGGAALVAGAVGYYFRRVSRVTVGEIEFLSARISGFDRSRSGVVVCDYVDVGTLATLAAQYGVQQRPDELERSTAGKSDLRAEIGVGSSKVGGGHEDTITERALYRAQSDPNVLTQDVLEALDRVSGLNVDLAALPKVGLEELRQIASSGGKIDAEEIYEELLATSKTREFEALANTEEFILIDSEWFVERDRDSVMLRLARLGDSAASSQMPKGAGLVVPVLSGPQEQMGQAMWTAQGRLRLREGARIGGSVLGRGGPYDSESHTLWVLPIVIFARLGRQSASGSREEITTVERSMTESHSNRSGASERAVSTSLSKRESRSTRDD